MQPYYFLHLTAAANGQLTGYFDYRPKDTNEAVVAATSSDGGRSWKVVGKALELNAGVCPNGNTTDDGQGHPFTLKVPAAIDPTTGATGPATFLYTLDRPTADRLGSGLLIHRVQPRASNPLAGLPASEPVNTGATTTVTANATVPAGLGAAGVSIDVGDTSGFTEIPGRIYVGGVPMYCQDSTPSSFRGCVTSNPSAAAAKVGESVGTDPVIPPVAGATSGLVAPDGLVAQVPGYRPPGAPRGAVTVMYVDKQLDYFAPASTTSALALGGTVNLPVTATSRFTSFPVTVHLGTGTNSNPGPIVAVTCTGASGNSELTGCTGGRGTVAKSSLVGAPGACVTPYSTLAKIGEGKNKPTSLFKNNEDYANVQLAWTVDGVHFHDLSTTNPVTGLADPTSATGLRFVAPGGAIVHNPDHSRVVLRRRLLLRR